MVPCFHEEASLESTLRELVAYLDASHRSWQLIVVDDGSTDRTFDIARGWSVQDPRVLAIRLPRNKGKGGALKAGFAAANGRVIAFADADMAYPTDAIDAVVAAVEAGADFAAGVRPSKSTGGYSTTRRLASAVFGQLLRATLPTRERDTQCGLKAFRDVPGKILFAGLYEEGFAFDVELFVVAGLGRLQVTRVPVTMIHREDSRVHLVRDSLGMAKAIARIRWRVAQGTYDKTCALLESDSWPETSAVTLNP